MSSLHERRIEVNDIDERGIHYMAHGDDIDMTPCFFTLSVKEAREMAAELLEAADDLELILQKQLDFFLEKP